MTFIPDKSPIEVALGNVAGRRNVQVGGRNPAVGTSFEDIWDAGGVLTYATAGEQWEIVSDSANDAAAGTGARTVLVNYLDDNYLEQTEIVTLNGTTPVSFVATDAFRMQGASVLTWGTVDGTNLGNLTIRVVGGVGDATKTRCGILFDDDVAGDENGLNFAQDGRYTVPAGKTLVSMSITTNVSKNHDVILRSQVRFFGSDGFLSIGEMSNYQSAFFDDFSAAPITLPEKSDIRFRARSNNTAVPVTVIFVFVLVDN